MINHYGVIFYKGFQTNLFRFSKCDNIWRDDEQW